MSKSTIELDQLTDAVADALSQRQVEAARLIQQQAAEAERAAASAARREAEQATAADRARRRADEALLAELQTKITAAHAHLQTLVEEYRALPNRIAIAEGHLSVCLQQAQQLRLQLGVRN